MNELTGSEKNYPDQAAKQAYRDDVTVRQNIDGKIERLQAQIVELQKAKAELEPLLDIRLDLLRIALQR